MDKSPEEKPLQKSKNWEGLSSQVGRTSYNEEQKVLTVTFVQGGVYNYYDVPVDVWKKLLVTTSVGRFINTDIKPHYTVKKMN